MRIAPKWRGEWLRVWFIVLEVLSISSCLATRAFGDWGISEDRGRQIGLVGLVSGGLLLVSSILFVFEKDQRRRAVWGFVVTALFILGMMLLPMSRTFI